MSMPIKACGGAEYFRGACRDRYLGRRDCADCEPLTPPAVEGDGRTVSVDLTSGDASPSDAQQPADPPADPTPAASTAKPRAPRGAPKRP